MELGILQDKFCEVNQQIEEASNALKFISYEEFPDAYDFYTGKLYAAMEQQRLVIIDAKEISRRNVELIHYLALLLLILNKFRGERWELNYDSEKGICIKKESKK